MNFGPTQSSHGKPTYSGEGSLPFVETKKEFYLKTKIILNEIIFYL